MPTQNSNKVAEPTTLAIVAAGATIVSAAFTTLGYFAQRAENRRIIGALNQIKSYLIDLNNKIEEIREQNKAILKKLDELPGIIARLLREETLNEKYNDLNSFEIDYYSVRGGEFRYRITSEGWKDLNKTITSIVQNEFRVSMAFKILQACEFSLAATELLSTPAINILIQQKIAVYIIIKDELYEKVLLSFNKVLNFLDNKGYVLQHNFNEHLENLEYLKYTSQPAKAINENYIEKIPHHMHQEPVTYTYVPAVRDNPAGIAFNNAMANHLQLIKTELIIFQKRIDDYKEIRDIIKAFEFYIQMINDDFSKQEVKSLLPEKLLDSTSVFIQIK